MSTFDRTDQEHGAVTIHRRDDILVGIDESPASAAALRWAADLSRTTGAPLRLLHAWQMSSAAAAALAAGTAGYIEAATADARARATRWVLDTLGGDAAQIRWTLQVIEGGPGPALVEQARTARLLVVGTREHRGIRRAISGSVSHYCLSHADVPVVAVPRPLDTDGEPPRDQDVLIPGPLL